MLGGQHPVDEHPMRITPSNTRPSLPRGWLPRRCRGPLLGGLRLRCRARWERGHLDEQLASGADPIESDELSLRTGQLSSAESRDRIAAALERAVELADQEILPPPVVPPRISREEIRDCRTLLLDLARCVRDAGPSDVQGLAMTARLISDNGSPLYRGGSTELLASAVFSALFALEPQRSSG